jgi:hypothetical protein
MSSEPLAVLPALLPVALLVLQAVLNVPQLVRLFRAEHGGVPLTGEALSLICGLGWLAWAALEGDPAIALSALLALAGFGPSTWLLLRAGSPWHVAGALVGAVVCVVGVGLLVGGIGAFGTLLTALAVVQYGAYLLAAARCTDWAGYSSSSGVLRVVYGLGWTLHGRWQGNVLLVVWGLLTASTFSVTFATAMVWRRRHATGRVVGGPVQTHGVGHADVVPGGAAGAGGGHAPPSPPALVRRPGWSRGRGSSPGRRSRTRASWLS